MIQTVHLATQRALKGQKIHAVAPLFRTYTTFHASYLVKIMLPTALQKAVVPKTGIAGTVERQSGRFWKLYQERYNACDLIQAVARTVDIDPNISVLVVP
jgi:hypothetical protein